MSERLTPERLAEIREQVAYGGLPDDMATVLLAELDALRRERDEADALCAELRRDLDRERRE